MKKQNLEFFHKINLEFFMNKIHKFLDFLYYSNRKTEAFIFLEMTRFFKAKNKR